MGIQRFSKAGAIFRLGCGVLLFLSGVTSFAVGKRSSFSAVELEKISKTCSLRLLKTLAQEIHLLDFKKDLADADRSYVHAFRIIRTNSGEVFILSGGSIVSEGNRKMRFQTTVSLSLGTTLDFRVQRTYPGTADFDTQIVPEQGQSISLPILSYRESDFRFTLYVPQDRRVTIDLKDQDVRSEVKVDRRVSTVQLDLGPYAVCLDEALGRRLQINEINSPLKIPE